MSETPAPLQPARGRFAPSPTGPLHFGSLVAAVASYLHAKHLGGEWWLRIEDLDPPREVPGAADNILRTLEQFGFEWDGPVEYQSKRYASYEAALEQLKARDLLYPCACSRREIADSSLTHDGALIYPGTCRHGLAPGRTPRAWRVRTHNRPIHFHDTWQGPQRAQLETDTGDFVLRRADGFYAYQLAVVVDDAAQGITHIVRGADLLDSTPRQIHLQQLLGYPTPHYAHLPVVVDQHGEKLSKQAQSPALNFAQPLPTLLTALDFLGQTPPPEIAQGNLKNFWQAARQHWQPEKVPRTQQCSAPPGQKGESEGK